MRAVRLRAAFAASLLCGVVAVFTTDVPGAFASTPVNDNFAGARVIGALPYADGVDTTEATEEVGESLNCGVPYGKTIWYRYTPTEAGRYQARSTGSAFDTVIAVWTGPSLDALTFVICSDDTSGVRTSRLQFDGAAGTTYYFQMAGWSGDGSADSGAGYFILESFPDPPANNNLASAVAVSPEALQYHDSGRTDGATIEVGEPRDCTNIGATMWYVFTPALSGSYLVDTAGSDFNTVVAVFDGTTFATMLPVSCNDNNPAGGLLALAQFNATAGVGYRIQVGGRDGDGGTVELHIGGEDSDGDGCSNIEEGMPNPVFGGDRDSAEFYDFFDTTGDAAIDLDDTLLILAHFGHGPNDDEVDDLLDRHAYDPAKPYRPGSETGDDAGIDLQDALLNLASFGHSCADPP